MSMWNQIWHVVRKDVRRFRWLLLAQCAVTAVAALAAIGPRAHSGERPVLVLAADVAGGWPVAVVIMAVLLTALVVQADSPSRSDAFWASRPLRPLAVLLAKAVTLAGFLLVLPVVADALVLASHSVSPIEMAPMLRDGFLVHLSTVLAAGTLAALTSDLATFFAAAVGGGVATVVVTGLVMKVFDGAYGVLTMTQLAIPLLLLGGGVLLYQYSSRNLRRSVVTAVAGSVLGLVLLGAISVPTGAPNVATAPPELIGSEIVWGPFDVEPLPRRNAGEAPTWALRTTIQLDGTAPRYEYALLGATTRLELADGTVVDSRRFGTGPLTPTTGRILSATATRGVSVSARGSDPVDPDWLIQRVDDPGPDRVVVAHLSRPQLELLAAEGGRLELTGGRVDVLASRELGSLPVSSGADIEADARRFRVLSVGSAGSGGPLVEVYSEEVRAYASGLLPRTNEYTRFALVNRSTREGVAAAVQRRATYRHGSVLAGGWFTRTGRLLIETPTVVEDGGLVPARSSAWFADAELMIIEVTSVGGYPVTGAVDVRLGEGPRSDR
jgi:hypothetical protein